MTRIIEGENLHHFESDGIGVRWRQHVMCFYRLYRPIIIVVFLPIFMHLDIRFIIINWTYT